MHGRHRCDETLRDQTSRSETHAETFRHDQVKSKTIN